MVGLLGCECTLVAHVQLFMHQYPQVFLGRAALNPFIPQPILIPEVALIQLQDLALGLVEPQERFLNDNKKGSHSCLTKSHFCYWCILKQLFYFVYGCIVP